MFRGDDANLFEAVEKAAGVAQHPVEIEEPSRDLASGC